MRSVLLSSKFVYMDSFVSAPKYYIHIVSFFGTLPRVLAVGSCWDLSGWSFTLCRWFSRSNPWGSKLFWVITMQSLSVVPLSNLKFWDQILDSGFLIGYFYYRLGAVMCMGVTAGAYILTLFAVCSSWNSVWSSMKSLCWSDQFAILQLKYRERVLGLILISPLCKSPSWSEWFYNKVPFSNLFTNFT